MTLHKIDREKLAEAIALVSEDDRLCTNFYSKYQSYPEEVVLKAAQNWLTITDPGFEASESVRHAVWMCVDWHSSCVDDDCIPKIMDAMIAKAGE